MSEKGTHNKMRRYSNSDSSYLPSKYTSKNSTLQSPKETHPSSINDINSPQISQDYNPIVQNVIALPEIPGEVFMKFNSSQLKNVLTK